MDAKIAAVSEEVRALREMVRRLERATPRDDIARRHRDSTRARRATTTARRSTEGSATPRRRAEDADDEKDDETAVDARFRARCRAHVAKESSSIDDASMSLDAVTRQFTLGVVRRLPEDASKSAKQS